MVWCAQVLMHVIAHRGCMDNVRLRASALTVGSGNKILCPAKDSNLLQYCVWFFSRTLYQLSYPIPPLPTTTQFKVHSDKVSWYQSPFYYFYNFNAVSS